MILSLDIGTTNWKAGIINDRGVLTMRTSMPAKTLQIGTRNVYDPADCLPAACALLEGLPGDSLAACEAVTITGMAEGGLIVDADGTPRCEISPWFDAVGKAPFERLADDERFRSRWRTGLPDSPKYSAFKALAMLEALGVGRAGDRWLGVPEYIAFLLTGRAATDPTLAARTYAYDIVDGCWDEPFLRAMGVNTGFFPPVLPSGAPMGTLKSALPGVRTGIPVCICGHDHLLAAYGTDAFAPGRLFVSAGTAQVLLGMSCTPFSRALWESGLSFAPSPVGEYPVCLGSVQAAGASISWIDRLLYQEDDCRAMIADSEQGTLPSGALYYPYLFGSGAPHMGACDSAAFLCLTAKSTRAQLALSVYEGVAMETRLIAEAMALPAPESITMVGGLTRHPRYLAIIAAVLGVPVRVPGVTESTLLGAARLCALRMGKRTAALPPDHATQIYCPDEHLQAAYDAIYRERYIPRMNAVCQKMKASE